MTVTRRDVWVRMLLYPRHTLPTAAAPVLVAVGLARRDSLAAWLPAGAAFVAGWLVQLGGVIADNYFNLTRHPEDREHALFVQALKAGVVTLAELRRAIWGCYVGAVVVGVYLVAVGGGPVIVVGLASIAASLAYSAGPRPLGDNGLGDPLFFLFFGVVSVAATYYVQTGAVTALAFVASLPVGALTTNILVIDNIRDLEHDREKNERTFAVLIGAHWSGVEYVALLGLAYATPVWMWLHWGVGPLVLLPLLSIPYAAVVARRVLRARSHDQMIPLTPQAGQVLLAYCLLFGIALGA
jgi:1,4-dihydroxy-2-naphthoate polyprenyltransferase